MRQRCARLALLLLLLVLPLVAIAQPTGIELVSQSSTGVAGIGGTDRISISSDGRYVAFRDSSPKLVPGDTNGAEDIFVRDVVAKTTERVSLTTTGTQADDDSASPSISADGRYVAFQSKATNLVPGYSDLLPKVYVRDRVAGTTMIVSVSSSGGQANASSSSPSISADGRYVAFVSSATNLVAGDTNGRDDVFVRDLKTNTTSLVSISSSGLHGNSNSQAPWISGDGRYVAFTSYASNLVSGDTNGKVDIFVRDLQAGLTTIASVSTTGVASDDESFDPRISANGRYVTFTSYSKTFFPKGNLRTVEVYVHDLQTGVTDIVSLPPGGAVSTNGSDSGSISGDGRYVAFSTGNRVFPWDGNGCWDIVVRDRQTNDLQMLSLTFTSEVSNGQSYAPQISADGRYVAFVSQATTLVEPWLSSTQQTYITTNESHVGSSALSSFVITPSTVYGVGEAAGTVTLKAPAPARGRTVALTSSLGLVLSYVTVPAGQTSVSFPIRIFKAVSSPTTDTIHALHYGDDLSAVLTLKPIDSFVLSFPDTPIGSGKSIWGTLTLPGKASIGGFFVSFGSSNTNAIPPPTSLTVPAGQSKASVLAQALVVPRVTTVTINAGKIGFPLSSAKVTVLPPPVKSFTLSQRSIVGGSHLIGTVAIDMEAGIGGVIVKLRSTDPSVASVPSQVTIPAGAKSVQFEIQTSAVSTYTSVWLVANTESTGGYIATLGVVRAPMVLTSLSASPTTLDTGGTAIGTVTLSDPALQDGYVVNIANSQPTYFSAPTTVTVPEGATTTTFTISAPVRSTSASGYLTASHPGSPSQIVVLRSTGLHLVSVTATPNPVVGGSTCLGVVTINAPAPAGGYVVNLKSSQPSFLSVPATVTIPAGSTSRSFAITTTKLPSGGSGYITCTHSGSQDVLVVVKVTKS